MAKTKVSEWDSVAANNTDINSININEGCPPSTINNAIRETMAQIKDLQGGYSGDTIPVAAGGTGATTAGAARTNLGITGTATQDPSSVNFTGGSITGLTNLSTGIFSATGVTTLSGATTASSTLTSSGTLAVTGGLTLDGAAGTSGQYLTSAGSGTPTWTTLTIPTAFVTGMIMLWSGTVATIPTGWLLCDGTSSTPDLRNRFVIGAHSDSGGAAKTTVTGSSTLSGGSKDAIVVSHTHTASSSSENAHSHTYDKSGSVTGNVSGYSGSIASGSAVTNTNTVPAHNHTITVSSAGSSGTNANLPPYYALAYIMKS
jgi:hypothetical protein